MFAVDRGQLRTIAVSSLKLCYVELQKRLHITDFRFEGQLVSCHDTQCSLDVNSFIQRVTKI